jgi:hypothetical protein
LGIGGRALVDALEERPVVLVADHAGVGIGEGQHPAQRVVARLGRVGGPGR